MPRVCSERDRKIYSALVPMQPITITKLGQSFSLVEFALGRNASSTDLEPNLRNVSQIEALKKKLNVKLDCIFV